MQFDFRIEITGNLYETEDGAEVSAPRFYNTIAVRKSF
jgi:hypothetical protein